MGMFHTREPRKFRPVSLYTDERKERLKKLVDEVRREQGETPVEEKKYNPAKFKGTFINYTPHVQRSRERAKFMGWPLYIVVLFALLVIWRFLLR